MTLRIEGLATLLSVFDMTASLEFYTHVLEFEVVASAGAPDDLGWVLLRYGGVELMLNTLHETPDRPARPDPERVAAHSDTCLYFQCADVDAAYAQLETHGVVHRKPEIAPYGMKQLFFNDPDGYTICLQHPVATGTS